MTEIEEIQDRSLFHCPCFPSLMRAVRDIVSSVDTNLPVLRMRTQSDSIDRLLFNERLVARLLGLFAALGLMLACIGLYGLLSYEVTRRTREIGIRTALGAQRGTIWSMVVRQGILWLLWVRSRAAARRSPSRGCSRAFSTPCAQLIRLHTRSLRGRC